MADALATSKDPIGRELTIRNGTEECKLLLFDGIEPAAIQEAVAARLGLGDARFYFTKPGAEAVVPLSAALPNGFALALHLCSQQAPALSSSRSSRQDGLLGSVQKNLASSGPRSFPGASASSSAQPLLSNPAATPVAIAEASAEPKDLEMMASGSSQPPRTAPRSGMSRSHSAPGSYSVDENGEPVRTATTLAEDHSIMAAAATNIDRFSRLSTDLANERTLLAWTRTGLASMRTVFAFFGLEAIGAAKISVYATQVAMVCVSLVAVIAGYMRYMKIKRATLMPIPPVHFGRGSVHWMMSFIAICFISVALGVVSENWRKGL